MAQKPLGNNEPISVAETSSRRFTLNYMTRFFADFTLGFADGLTVPFALTAGLSWLGHTDTVIYAGMAEICAGCISMGIGGYLSAKGEKNAAAAAASAGQEQEEEKIYDQEEEDCWFPQPDGCGGGMTSKAREEDPVRSPITAGLFVALGYLLGGSLPLFPYFIVTNITDGLIWSFAVCIAALFLFGFSKDYVLNRRQQEECSTDQLHLRRGGRIPWREFRHSGWEGLVMAALGGFAAGAAVLCVMIFESMRVVMVETGTEAISASAPAVP
ncbi:VIT family-domain-containing protein [Bombardia bombarda]|uniref:VIT family-domain-containing protein n=1 Tax=Bombardia bombarda TaxID=252184 RepID=A0AA40CAI2_9PEZI|nr:VIT family-domain-containing protein [Bombardia bombarda]